MSKMTRYAEAKSVKVDNWGVFFLQKLQNFFNKTDHCDLTLQFNDNSQLKVHRLVLSACTDYFNHLENVCEMYDDVLIMPMDLQADVIVPIVNFMYTGTLEFQYNMYDRLLKTATDMNMTVLLKLLEAHRQTSSRIVKQPVLLNKQAPRPRGAPVYQGAGPRVMPAQRGANVGPRPRLPVARQPMHMYGHKGAGHSTAKDVKPGPSRFDDGEMGEGFEGSFDGITYETKPLLTADQVKKEEETSPFEKLRKGYTNANVVKRSSSGSLTSPPAKKPNLDEVKEFTEAARMRSQLATANDDDSPDYVDDDTHFNDDDDEDYQPPASVKAALAKSASHHAGTVKHGTIKQESKSPGSGGNSSAMKQITVKDDSGSVDHAKIISEVLKKYPHLVKKNKNIKLKIMQKPSPNNANATNASSASSSAAATPKMEVRTATPLKQDLSMVRRATANIRSETAKPSAGSTTSTGKPTTGTTKTIDAKTMHALIAKGAENTTGPWLCLRCGINGRPISIPSYKAFYNHLIHKHKERIDVRICEHCGFKAQQRNPHLIYHWFTEHKVKPTIKFPRCDECDHVAMTADDLQKHEEEAHSRGDLQQCIYCNKVFAKEMELYDHMKEQHKARAIADGVLEFTDDEDYQSQEEEVSSPQAGKTYSAQGASGEGKIKILSNITLPPAKGSSSAAAGGSVRHITLEPSSEAEALSNVASGIATSLTLVGDNGVVIDDPNYQNQFIEAELASVHGENASTGTETTIPKLVTADGTELQLTQSQKDEIISQLQNTGGGNDVVMVLNEDNFSVGSTIQLDEGVQIVDTSSQNIMVMYSQPEGGESEHNDSQKSDAKVAAADVTTASEDDNSQASVSLSEDKAASSIADKQPSLEGGDESQESRRTDASDKPEAEDEGNTTMDDDVDMSGGDVTSETNETLQQAVKDELMDLEDELRAPDTSADGTKEDELNDSEDRQQSDKLKLISELEGDWSEDTAEEQPGTPAVADVSEKPATKKVTATATVDKKATASTPAAKTASKPTGGEKKPVAEAVATGKKRPLGEAPAAAAAAPPSKERKKSGGEEKLSEKEIDKLLDDWNNEAKLDELTEEADLEKEIAKVTGVKAAETGESDSKKPNEVKKDTAAADATKHDKPDTTDADADKPTAEEEEQEEDVEEEETVTPAEEGKESFSVKGKKNGTASATETSRSKLEDTSELDEEQEEDDDDGDEEDKDKANAKSKEVSSLLGEWDEDDDL
ncbi:centrosome-associated zinc finger protein CP190 [Anopheles stephensi]|uniref:centrosome-associated zinc finger protein CP190 n=1 Tax=Anopheles stephensi TaxID=30069 RepID=UPI0016589538|nr:centrosome-associated zinc finger protein CP190 [Anopheles stephensi]